MLLRHLDATFGKLEHCSLTFTEGLNVIEAPNESGKSTLLAFLRVMLYGLRSSERGMLADKNRFLPWSGKTMSGTLELTTEIGNITLQRNTTRANSPMGHFSAVYTGTADEVPNLTGADCGERLLGVPREVYERSAFIRQSGLAIDSDAELERRIAALITTGEEGASYSEVSDKLKKQLNAHKFNKKGKIPMLEAELSALTEKEAELKQLTNGQIAAREELSTAQEEIEQLREMLAAHDLADKQDAVFARQAAEREVGEADTKCELLYRMIRDAKTPGRETLEQTRAKLCALNDLEAQQKAALEKQQAAKATLAQFNAGDSGRRAALPPAMLASAAVCAVFCLIAVFLWENLIGSASFGIASVAFLLLSLSFFRKENVRKQAAAQKRAELEKVLQQADASVNVLSAAFASQHDAVLSDLPVSDLAHANAYIEENLSRYDLLSKLQQEADRAQMRLELLPVIDTSLPTQPISRPAENRDALQSRLGDAIRRAAEAQRRIDFTDGRIRTIGDRDDLTAAIAEKNLTLTILYNEYDALALAAETLERANAELQCRFSPALGKKAAELFSYLTDGKYQNILLDRSFHAQAEEAGDPISHDAALLSQGAADQLYLAVRLAICDLVLPEEKSIPLVLDDALTNFDDTRCQKALDLLLQESKKRQIILFTCQSRESAYLSGQDGVNLLHLSV